MASGLDPAAVACAGAIRHLRWEPSHPRAGTEDEGS